MPKSRLLFRGFYRSSWGIKKEKVLKAALGKLAAELQGGQGGNFLCLASGLSDYSMHMLNHGLATRATNSDIDVMSEDYTHHCNRMISPLHITYIKHDVFSDAPLDIQPVNLVLCVDLLSRFNTSSRQLALSSLHRAVPWASPRSLMVVNGLDEEDLLWAESEKMFTRVETILWYPPSPNVVEMVKTKLRKAMYPQLSENKSIFLLDHEDTSILNLSNTASRRGNFLGFLMDLASMINLAQVNLQLRAEKLKKPRSGQVNSSKIYVLRPTLGLN